MKIRKGLKSFFFMIYTQCGSISLNTFLFILRDLTIRFEQEASWF